MKTSLFAFLFLFLFVEIKAQLTPWIYDDFVVFENSKLAFSGDGTHFFEGHPGGLLSSDVAINSILGDDYQRASGTHILVDGGFVYYLRRDKRIYRKSLNDGSVSVIYTPDVSTDAGFAKDQFGKIFFIRADNFVVSFCHENGSWFNTVNSDAPPALPNSPLIKKGNKFYFISDQSHIGYIQKFPTYSEYVDLGYFPLNPESGFDVDEYGKVYFVRDHNKLIYYGGTGWFTQMVQGAPPAHSESNIVYHERSVYYVGQNMELNRNYYDQNSQRLAEQLLPFNTAHDPFVAVDPYSQSTDRVFLIEERITTLGDTLATVLVEYTPQSNGKIHLSMGSELEPSVIKIYPNPSAGSVHLEGGDVRDVVVFNTQGVLVSKPELSENYIDLSDLDNGVYFLQISTKYGREVKKINLLK